MKTGLPLLLALALAYAVAVEWRASSVDERPAPASSGIR